MNRTAIIQKPIYLFLVTLLVCMLSACVQEQPASDEADSRPRTSGAATNSEPATPRASRGVPVTVPEGTQVHVTLSTDLGSSTSVVGDTLTATTTASGSAGKPWKQSV